MAGGQRRGRWSGVPLEDRQALRREDLIAAGVGLLGSEGGPALTVRAVCKAAGLTERYFYESFGDRDDFVRARSRWTAGGVELEPITGQESHMIVRSAAADALVHVQRGEGELPAGAAVRYLPL